MFFIFDMLNKMIEININVLIFKFYKIKYVYHLSLKIYLR